MLHLRNVAHFVQFVLLLSFLSAPVAAQTTASAQNGEETAELRPTLRTAALLSVQSVQVDGVLSEGAWADAESIANLITIEPEEGGEPVGRTVVKVLANSTEILIGVICYDPDPAGIVSTSKARDSELDEEDHVLFVLDTFLDGRTGYVFAVNPTGTLFDGLVTAQGTDVNSAWDGVWEARTTQGAEGWSAEIRIPVTSIGFKPGLSSWGFNVERRVERLQETSRWSGADQDYEIFQTIVSGTLTELPSFSLGLGLSIRPALTANTAGTAGEDRTYGSDASVDVTQKLGANLLGSLTVNTDFAETEVDARESNLTRFERLFPEKRTFFLEGADIFEFGLGLEGVMVPFFSRRIGLDEDGIEVPINAGGKLNGRIGGTNIGALVVNTRNVKGGDSGKATMGVARIKQNVFEESSFGLIGTVGDQLGRSGSWMTGGDFTYQTSKFRGNKNLSATVWGMRNGRSDLEDDKSAYGYGFDYPNDLWNFRFVSARLGDGFDPSLSYLRRKGVHLWNGAVAFEPRPEGAFVRQMFHRVTWSLVNKLDSQWESYRVAMKPFDWLLESGERFRFTVIAEGDRPDEEFSVFETEDEEVEIPQGVYQWRRFQLLATAAEKRAISGEVQWESGGYYEGNLDTVELSVALKRPLFRLEAGAERNIGRLPGGDFTQSLYNGRIELKFSPELQVSSFVQYDNESKSLGSNTRMRWTFRSFGDLFVVYNHNLQRSLSDPESRRGWNYDSNALIVKLQYTSRP